MQTDPIGYEDGMNWYAYVGNDPVNATDPTGNNTIALKGAWRIGQSIGNGINIATQAITGASLSTHIANAIYDAIHNEASDIEIEDAVDVVDDLAGHELIGEIEDGEGTVLDGMGDPKFDKETGSHDKVKNRTNADGTKTELHTERNRETQKVDSAKVKQDGKFSRKNN